MDSEGVFSQVVANLEGHTPNGKDASGSGSGTTATGPPLPVAPPELARNPQILNVFRSAIRIRGVVGEETTACTLYLILTSRVLDKQVSAAVKGVSGSGKSYTTEQTVAFFPPEAVLEMTAMSEHALVYMKEEFQHRTLVLYEAVALREGQEDNHTGYFVRSLLSEGHIRYPVVVRDKQTGEYVTRWIVKEGPTNLIVTTTKTQVHAENETRLLSFSTDDSQEQTERILAELAADEDDDDGSLSEWRELQAWLQGANHKVAIPYAKQLAKLVPAVAVRLRRDFGALLALVRAHAVLHQLSRDTDDKGRIVATVDDYAGVRTLVADVLSEGVDSTVSPTIRQTVEAVERLALRHKDGVPAAAVAKVLKLDKSAARRRLLAASDRDYVHNEEDRKGRPGRWVIGEPLPEDVELLPDPDKFAVPPPPSEPPPPLPENEATQGHEAGGGTVASVSGVKTAAPENPDDSDTVEALLARELGARVVDDGAVSGWSPPDVGGLAADPDAKLDEYNAKVREADGQLALGAAPVKVDHPARFSSELMPAIARPLAGWGLPVHDPFAGTGERLGRLCDQLGLPFTGTELEPEWIVDTRVREGDSTAAGAYPTGEYVIVTSPTYPNGMADHFRPRDDSKRNTYRQALQRTRGGIDRELHPNNTGRYNIRRGERIEAQYWRLARAAVAHWPDRAVVNVKDFYYENDKIYPTVAKWVELLEDHGYKVVTRDDVKTPGQRHGANRQRIETEAVLVCERASEETA